MSPQISHLPTTSEWELIWKWGLCRYNEVKGGLCWIQVGPGPKDRCLSKRRGHLKVQAGKRPQEDRQKLERFSHKPRNAEHRQEPREAGAFRSLALLTRTSGLQKGEKKNFCCFKPLSAIPLHGKGPGWSCLWPGRCHHLSRSPRSYPQPGTAARGSLPTPVWSHHACRGTPLSVRATTLREGTSSFLLTPPPPCSQCSGQAGLPTQHF